MQNATAVEAMHAATAASYDVARQLEAALKALGAATTTLQAIDPPRLWKFLGDNNKWQQLVKEKRLADAAATDARTRLILRVSSLAAVAAIGTAVIAGAALLGLGAR